MFNIESSMQLLASAEKVNNSRNLTDAEKIILLENLAATVMVDMPGCPEHAKVVRASIERMTRNERAAERNTSTEKQGRKAKRVKEPTEVDTGRAEESTQAPTGTPEGVEEQAKDAGRPDRAEPDASDPPSEAGKA